MSGLSLDLTAFEKQFSEVCNVTIPHLTEKGLFKAANELKLDADHVEPKTPVKEGTLKGSWKVEVEFLGKDTWTLVCGFNVDYASYVHEMVKKNPWTQSGSGPKFLESKLYMFSDKYIGIVAKVVAEGG